MTKGEFKIEKGRWAFYAYWPRIIKTNVNLGLQADTVLLISWFNEWSEYKSSSIAFKVLGFGLGLRKYYDKNNH